MHPSPPNILRSSVVGCARKYEESKKGVVKEFFSEIMVFLVKKGSFTTFNRVKIRRIWKKKEKIRKTWSMTKTNIIRTFGRENRKLFRKIVIQKSWSAKKISVPPKTRRQVSATVPSI